MAPGSCAHEPRIFFILTRAPCRTIYPLRTRCPSLDPLCKGFLPFFHSNPNTHSPLQHTIEFPPTPFYTSRNTASGISPPRSSRHKHTHEHNTQLHLPMPLRVLRSHRYKKIALHTWKWQSVYNMHTCLHGLHTFINIYITPHSFSNRTLIKS